MRYAEENMYLNHMHADNKKHRTVHKPVPNPRKGLQYKSQTPEKDYSIKVRLPYR